MKVHHLSRIAGSVGGSHGFGPSVGFSFMIFLLMSMFIRMKHYSYNLDHNTMRPRVDRPVEIEGCPKYVLPPGTLLHRVSLQSMKCSRGLPQLELPIPEPLWDSGTRRIQIEP